MIIIILPNDINLTYHYMNVAISQKERFLIRIIGYVHQIYKNVAIR